MSCQRVASMRASVSTRRDENSGTGFDLDLGSSANRRRKRVRLARLLHVVELLAQAILELACHLAGIDSVP